MKHLRISNFHKFRLYFLQSRQVSKITSPVALSYFKTINKDFDETKNPILIFHGLFGSKNNLKSTTNQISSRTKQMAYSFDLRNHGESPHVDGHQSDMNAMASDIKFFMEQNQIEKAVLLGHSLGGRVVGQFAFNWPEKVDKLILVDISPLPTLPKIDFLTPDFFEILEKVIKDLPSNLNLSQARNVIKAQLNQIIQNPFIVDFFMLNLYQESQTGQIKWRFNTGALKILIENRLASEMFIGQPFTGKSLIIYGKKSEYVKPEQFPEIQQIMPNVKFIGMDNTGHYLHVERANEFIGHVVEFLNQ